MFRKTFIIFLVVLIFASTGCEKVYYLLQKEGAQEKSLLGEALPLEPNPKVEEVQKLLKLFGYPVGNIDGKIGPGTRNAILKFQKDNDLEETRFVDQPTWQRLHYFDACGLVINGDVNFKAVQEALKNAGFNISSIDGKMGPESKRMLIAFQKMKGIKGDGIIGVQTMRFLSEHLQFQSQTNTRKNI